VRRGSISGSINAERRGSIGAAGPNSVGASPLARTDSLKGLGLTAIASGRFAEAGSSSATSASAQELWTMPDETDDMADEGDGFAAPSVVSNTPPSLGPQRVCVPLGPGVLGACAVGATPVLLDNAYVDQRFEPSVDEAAATLPVGRRTAGGASLACVPLLDQLGSCIGVLQTMGSQKMPLTQTHVTTMNFLAHVLACNVLLLKADGVPASEQVHMQRAVAGLQEESRAMRDSLLSQRRAMYTSFKPSPRAFSRSIVSLCSSLRCFFRCTSSQEGRSGHQL
jgi:hypothetical protein